MAQKDQTASAFASPHTAATLLAAVTFALTYTLCILTKLPTPRYFPLTGAWDLGPHAGTISMGYYGNLLVSALVGAAFYGLGRIGALRRLLAGATAARALTWGSAAVFVVCLIVQLVHELLRWGGR